MSSQEEPRYVRFGYLPRKPHSTDLLAEKRLEGVCVYPGRLDSRRGFVIDTSQLNWEQGLPTLIGLAATDRPAFFVEGEEVGTGPDGEPLVKVERSWPVPNTTNITSTALLTQNALRLWSKGPRDGSGEAFLKWRLGHKDSPYLPEDEEVENSMENPHARNARWKLQPGGEEKRRRKKKAQKKARKKQRKR